MNKDYKTNEIKEYITLLNKIDAKGISTVDQQHLTALLIQATPSIDLPTLHHLDIHCGLPVMISSYVGCPNTDTAYMLSNYIKHLYVDHFKETILKLIECEDE